MLSICLRDNHAAVASGTLKNDLLTINNFSRINGSFLVYLENIKSADDVTGAANYFKELFESISNNSTLKKEKEVYIVLPDYLFAVVDCFKYTSDEEIQNYIKTKLVNNLDDYYYNTPVFTRPTRVEKMVTAYVISKNIVDCIIEAAKAYNISIISIEAMSISFLRSLDKFGDREEVFLEVFYNSASIIGYSAIAGLFKMDIPDLANSNLISQNGDENTEKINTIIKETLASFEATADLTFEYFNPDNPIFVLSGERVVGGYKAISDRINRNPDISRLINSDRVSINDYSPFMAVVGTMLQNIDFTAEKYDGMLAENQLLLSSNVIPEDVKTATKMHLMLQKVEKISLTTIAVFTLCIICELIGLFLFSSTDIPPALQKEYNQKKESIKTIDTGLKLIEKYSTEHEYPTAALQHIINQKPDRVYFTNFIIDERRSGQVGNKWIELRAVSQDPLLFQDFLTSLASDSMFKDIIINQISSDSSGYKKANFAISKGVVKN